MFGKNKRAKNTSTKRKNTRSVEAGTEVGQSSQTAKKRSKSSKKSNN